MVAVAIPEPYQQHIVEAWHQLAVGSRRPTADSVLRAVGGSKATAVSAMQFFWASYVPSMLAGRTAQIPDPIARLAASVWESASRLANERAQAAVAEEKQALQQAQEAIAKEREAFAAAGLRHQAALADAVAKADRQAQSRMDAERNRHDAALAAECKRHDAKEERSARAIESLERSVEQLRSQRDQLKEERRAGDKALLAAQLTIEGLEAALATAKQDAEAEARRSEQYLAQLEASRGQLAELEQSHRAERAEIAKQHVAELDRVRQEHARELAADQLHHGEIVNQLKVDHDKMVTALKAQLQKQSRAEKRRQTTAKD